MVHRADRFRQLSRSLSALAFVLWASGCRPPPEAAPHVIDGDDQPPTQDAAPDPNDAIDAAPDPDDTIDAASKPSGPTPQPTADWVAVTPEPGNDAFYLMPEIAAAYVVPASGTSYVALVGSFTIPASNPPAGQLFMSQTQTDNTFDFKPWQEINGPLNNNNFTNSVSWYGPSASYSNGTLTVLWRRPSDGTTYGIAQKNGAWGAPFSTNTTMAFKGSVMTSDPTSTSPTPFAAFGVGTNTTSIAWISSYSGTALGPSPTGTWSATNTVPPRMTLQFGVGSSWDYGGGQKIFAVSNNQIFWSFLPANSVSWAQPLTALLDAEGRGPLIPDVQTAPSAVWCGNRTILVARDSDGNIRQAVRNPKATPEWSMELIGAVATLPAELLPPDLDASTTPLIKMSVPSPVVISRTSTDQSVCEYEIYVVGNDHRVYERTFMISN